MTNETKNTDWDPFQLKVKHILPRFLLIAFTTVFVVLLFQWVFAINSNTFEWKEGIYLFWIPMLSPWIPILLFLWKRTKIIYFKRGGDAQWLLLLTIWLTMTGMLITSNEYLKTSTGKLLSVNSIDDLNEMDADYLSIKELNVNRNLGSAHSTSDVTGRSGSTLNYKIFFTYSIHSNKEENQLKFWYGSRYTKNVSNRLSDKAKDRKYQDFFTYSSEHLLSIDFPPAHYYKVLPHSNDRDDYIKSIRRIKNIEVQTPVILVPMEGKFKDRNGSTLMWFFIFFAMGLILMMIVIGCSSFDEVEHQAQLEKRNH